MAEGYRNNQHHTRPLGSARASNSRNFVDETFLKHELGKQEKNITKETKICLLVK